MHAAGSIAQLHDDPLALNEGDRMNIALFLALQDSNTSGQERIHATSSHTVGRLRL
jgi:hypothetical protein